MTDDDILKLASECAEPGRLSWGARRFNSSDLIDFARRIRAQTIEECAAVCDGRAKSPVPGSYERSASHCASAIRALGQATRENSHE